MTRTPWVCHHGSSSGVRMGSAPSIKIEQWIGAAGSVGVFGGAETDEALRGPLVVEVELAAAGGVGGFDVGGGVGDV